MGLYPNNLAPEPPAEDFDDLHEFIDSLADDPLGSYYDTDDDVGAGPPSDDHHGFDADADADAEYEPHDDIDGAIDNLIVQQQGRQTLVWIKYQASKASSPEERRNLRRRWEMETRTLDVVSRVSMREFEAALADDRAQAEQDRRESKAAAAAMDAYWDEIGATDRVAKRLAEAEALDPEIVVAAQEVMDIAKSIEPQIRAAYVAAGIHPPDKPCGFVAGFGDVLSGAAGVRRLRCKSRRCGSCGPLVSAIQIASIIHMPMTDGGHILAAPMGHTRWYTYTVPHAQIEGTIQHIRRHLRRPWLDEGSQPNAPQSGPEGGRSLQPVETTGESDGFDRISSKNKKGIDDIRSKPPESAVVADGYVALPLGNRWRVITTVAKTPRRIRPELVLGSDPMDIINMAEDEQRQRQQTVTQWLTDAYIQSQPWRVDQRRRIRTPNHMHTDPDRILRLAAKSHVVIESRDVLSPRAAKATMEAAGYVVVDARHDSAYTRPILDVGERREFWAAMSRMGASVVLAPHADRIVDRLGFETTEPTERKMAAPLPSIEDIMTEPREPQPGTRVPQPKPEPEQPGSREPTDEKPTRRWQDVAIDALAGWWSAMTLAPLVMAPEPPDGVEDPLDVASWLAWAAPTEKYQAQPWA